MQMDEGQMDEGERKQQQQQGQEHERQHEEGQEEQEEAVEARKWANAGAWTAAMVDAPARGVYVGAGRAVEGWRPLHAAVHGGSAECVGLLLAAGALVWLFDGQLFVNVCALVMS